MNSLTKLMVQNMVFQLNPRAWFQAGDDLEKRQFEDLVHGIRTNGIDSKF